MKQSPCDGVQARTTGFSTSSHHWRELGGIGRLRGARLGVVEAVVLRHRHVEHALRHCVGHSESNKVGPIWLAGDLLEAHRSAARPKCNSSATVTKYLRCRSSMFESYPMVIC